MWQDWNIWERVPQFKIKFMINEEHFNVYHVQRTQDMRTKFLLKR